jgi:uncharacterized membrane protein YwzB
MAVAALAWLLLIPYGLTSGQLAPLAIAWAAILRRAVTPRTSEPLVVALLAVAGVLPWALYAVRFDVLAYKGLEVTGALVPLATAMVLAAAIARSARLVTSPERSAKEAATSP